ncbi:MAG: bifunctional pyr operon transcriptional regulator/uracil phosphoribosyltransferase, partial [Oceanobacter sp.]
MQLPNIIESIEQLGLQLGNHIATNQLVEPLFVGVHTGGAWIAEKLHQQLAIDTPLYSVDISFYRDDFTRNG